jgi:hypothetical protein
MQEMSLAPERTGWAIGAIKRRQIHFASSQTLAVAENSRRVPVMEAHLCKPSPSPLRLDHSIFAAAAKSIDRGFVRERAEQIPPASV